MFGNKLIQDIAKNDNLEFLQSYQFNKIKETLLCYVFLLIIQEIFHEILIYDITYINIT